MKDDKKVVEIKSLECKHGRLARACERCADEEEIAALKAQVKAAQNLIQEQQAKMEALIRVSRRTYKLLEKHYTEDYIKRVLMGEKEVE